MYCLRRCKRGETDRCPRTQSAHAMIAYMCTTWGQVEARVFWNFTTSTPPTPLQVKIGMLDVHSLCACRKKTKSTGCRVCQVPIGCYPPFQSTPKGLPSNKGLIDIHCLCPCERKAIFDQLSKAPNESDHPFASDARQVEAGLLRIFTRASLVSIVCVHVQGKAFVVQGCKMPTE